LRAPRMCYQRPGSFRRIPDGAVAPAVTLRSSGGSTSRAKECDCLPSRRPVTALRRMTMVRIFMERGAERRNRRRSCWSVMVVGSPRFLGTRCRAVIAAGLLAGLSSHFLKSCMRTSCLPTGLLGARVILARPRIKIMRSRQEHAQHHPDQGTRHGRLSPTP